MIKSRPRETLRILLLTLYYTAIVLGLLWMHFSSSFDMPKFIYQGF